jgi:hypothetical protein
VAKLNDSFKTTMAGEKLTKKQQQLIEEIDKTASLLVIDY